VWAAAELALRVFYQAAQVDGQVAARVAAAHHFRLHHPLVLL
jgi:hypothetical protein